ncbi:MAG: TIM barrel protein [Candidatus Diapherotrites archaeon]|nr:TIM barrel protein [Candidatus Diapherotrites archaeon]
MKAILEWGTYNGLTTLRKAFLLGLRLTEIPPGDFMKRRSEEYFDNYREMSSEFNVVTAHGPYYALTGKSMDSLERSWRAHVRAIQMAERAGAMVYNVHIGGAGPDRETAIHLAAKAVKMMLDATENILITLETTYTPKLLGSPDDIRAIIEIVGDERVGISFQLENDFIREFKVYEDADFHGADQQVTEDFWINLLESNEDLFAGHVSLRFSQVTGLYLRKRIFVKKRTPLGMGYPSLDVLSRALADYIVSRVDYENTQVHLIYTGPPETKYRDTINFYYSVAKEVAEYL